MNIKKQAWGLIKSESIVPNWSRKQVLQEKQLTSLLRGSSIDLTSQIMTFSILIEYCSKCKVYYIGSRYQQ